MQRPTVVTVFGILNIIFGALGLCGSGVAIGVHVAANMQNPVVRITATEPVFKAWMMFALAIGLAATILLIVAGIGLLQMKPWARVVSVWYGIYGIVMPIVALIMNAVYLFGPLISQAQSTQGPESAAAVGGIIGGVVGGCFGVVYPAILLIFMTRPRVVAAFGPTEPGPADVPPGFADFAGTAPSTTAAAYTNPYTAPAPYATPVPLAGQSDAGVEVVASIIPYRNTPALAAYYLGLFSLIACIPFVGVIGVGMAITAFVLGIKGLRKASENPQAKGKVHAWIGIIGGGICGLLGLIIHVGMIIALIASLTASQK